MKGKEDGTDSKDTSHTRTAPLLCGRTSRPSSAPDTSSLSSFLHQEELCKELYLSMGVHPSDVAATSDDDVASILEQISKFHPSQQHSGATGDRNIEDILREAESLLHCQQASLPMRPITSCISFNKESGSEPSETFQAQINVEDDQPFQVNRQTPHLQRHLNKTHTLPSILDLKSDLKVDGNSGEPSQAISRDWIDEYETLVPVHVAGTPLDVTYKRIYEQIRKEVDGSLEPHLTGEFPDFKLSLPIPGLNTPAFDVPGCFSLEQEFLEERKRSLKLKADLDWLKRYHEREVANLRHHHEDQLKQVWEELSTTCHQDLSVVTLQNELKEKDEIISQYEIENEKMCTEIDDIKRLLLKLMALLKTDNDSVCVFP